MSSEKLRNIEIPERLYLEIERTLADEKTATLRLQSQPGNCTLIVVYGPSGDIDNPVTILDIRCGGKCGLFDRFLGRSCNRGNIGTSSGEVHVACTCRGGWFDSIFARS